MSLYFQGLSLQRDEAKRMGNDTMLTISFDNGQVKKVMANFARIEKL